MWDNNLQQALRAQLASMIPTWHFDMLQDTARNRFYEKIIRTNVKGKVVMDLGSGSGLLSILALRYGAKRVIAVEQNPVLAFLSQAKIVELGLQDRIRVFPRLSFKIATREIPPVDIILHEIFGADPFAEHVVRALRDARRFLKPTGTFLPEAFQLTFAREEAVAAPKVRYGGIHFDELTRLAPFALKYHLAQPSELSSHKIRGPILQISELIESQGPRSWTLPVDEFRSNEMILVSFDILHKNLRHAAYHEGKGRHINHWKPRLFLKNPDNKKLIRVFLRRECELFCD